ncbi:hypothetical protein PVK06_049963 [Gossypium arboreum]|uniref:Uncharacterized protein n=1 Tax=Gossypium arboreum TaxID=29729 RepID=A0ABR0M9Z2_GOSAR|nr:hypothetical protein PVK06_049963 [Gossypium arboreum]
MKEAALPTLSLKLVRLPYLPSGVEKLIDSRCRATIGIVYNPNHGALLMCILSPAVALCAGPEAIPDLDLNDFPPDISPAESAQLERETEENARECDRLHNEIFQKTKEIARAAGVDDNQKLEKIVDAVKFLSDVEDLAEEARIPYLHEFKAKIENKETWFEIDKEMKRWGGRGL